MIENFQFLFNDLYYRKGKSYEGKDDKLNIIKILEFWIKYIMEES